jgi:hypothetical protein
MQTQGEFLGTKKQALDLLALIQGTLGKTINCSSLQDLEKMCQDCVNHHESLEKHTSTTGKYEEWKKWIKEGGSGEKKEEVKKEEVKKEEVKKEEVKKEEVKKEEVKKEEVKKDEEKAKEHENTGGETSGTKKEEKIVIQHGPEIGLDCCMPELLTRMKACSDMNVAAIHVNCGIPTPIDWGSPVFRVGMGTFLDYVKQHPRFFLCPVENEPLFRYGNIMMTKSFVDSIPDTLVTQKTLAIRKIGAEEKKKEEEEKKKEEEEKKKEEEEKKKEEEEKKKENIDDIIKSILALDKNELIEKRFFDKLVADGATMTPSELEKVIDNYARSLVKNGISTTMERLIELYDTTDSCKIVEPLFMKRAISGQGPERELMALFFACNGCTGRNRGPLVHRYFEYLSTFGYSFRTSSVLIARAIKCPGKVVEYYVNFMTRTGQKICYEHLVELFTFYGVKTDQLRPFMGLIDIKATGVFPLMYTHVIDHEGFVKPFLSAMELGLFKIDPSEILKALTAEIQWKLDRAHWLFALLEKLPKRVEELMNDSSLICYLSNKHPEVRKELEEYRLHYSY